MTPDPNAGPGVSFVLHRHRGCRPAGVRGIERGRGSPHDPRRPRSPRCTDRRGERVLHGPTGLFTRRRCHGVGSPFIADATTPHAILTGTPRPGNWTRRASRSAAAEPTLAVPMVLQAPRGGGPSGPLLRFRTCGTNGTSRDGDRRRGAEKRRCPPLADTREMSVGHGHGPAVSTATTNSPYRHRHANPAGWRS